MYAGTDFDMLYYTTTNEKVKGDHRSEITGAKKPDIWIMKKNENGTMAEAGTGGRRD